MHTAAVGLGHGTQESGCGALAVGPGHMDGGRQTMMRIAQFLEQGPNPVEPKIDCLGMQGNQTIKNRFRVFHLMHFLSGELVMRRKARGQFRLAYWTKRILHFSKCRMRG